MEQNPNKNPQSPNTGDNKKKGSILAALLITVVIVLLIALMYNAIVGSKYTAVKFSDFEKAKEAGQLAEVEFHADRIIYLTKEEAAKPAEQQKACFTGLPTGGDTLRLAEELTAMGVENERIIVEDNSWIIMILSYAIMFGFIFLMMRSLTKRMSGDGMLGSFGASKAKVYMEKQTGVTFQDVAGQDEA